VDKPETQRPPQKEVHNAQGANTTLWYLCQAFFNADASGKEVGSPETKSLETKKLPKFLAGSFGAISFAVPYVR
jgi:hypothetical protein